MYLTACGKNVQLARFQIKLVLLFNAGVAVLLFVITPFIFGMRYLDSIAVSFILERFTALTGIVLMTPLFLPEHDKDVAELVESKYTAQIRVTVIRLIMSLLFLFVAIAGMVFWLHLGECKFEVARFMMGASATAFFLGSLGFISYGIADNVVVGYLIPIGYYFLNFFSGSDLGSLYLFSLSKGSFHEKYWLFGLGCLFIIVTLVWRYSITKKR